jgi:hypothetical protein
VTKKTKALTLERLLDGKSSVGGIAIMKKFLSYLIITLLVLILSSCGGKDSSVPSGEDELPPTLVISGGEYLETTSSSVTIEGQLSDDIGIQSFQYSLDGGEYKDVLASVKDKSFQFVVEGLKNDDSRDVDNEIEIVARDAKQVVEQRVFVNIVTFPNVYGRWQALETTYEACGNTQKAKLLVNFALPKQNGSVGGFGAALLNNQAAQLQVDAAVDNTTTIAGKVEIIQGGKSVVGDLRLESNGSMRVGTMTFAQWTCEDGTANAVTINVTFSKNNRPMTITENSKNLTDEVIVFEPNNKPSEATGLALPFRSLDYYMIVDLDDKEDWFSFSLTEPSIITAALKPSQPMSQQSYNLAFYDSNAAQIYPLSSDGRTGLLQTGDYYVKVSAAENSSLYDFELSEKPVADNALEPNQNREQATAMPSGFQKLDMVVSDADEDWFRFELTTPREITLTLDAFYGIEYTIYLGDTEVETYQSAGFQGPQPVTTTLEAGTYYLRVVEKSSYPFLSYSLSFY